MSRKAQSHEGEMAEIVLQPTGIMGDTLCPRCGIRFEVDGYCTNGHMKPTPKPATLADIFKEAWAKIAHPATGEWTAENVLMMLQGSQHNTPYSDIADAHNAALAAERQYGSAVTGASISAEDEIQQLREQLAAERKTVKEYDDYIKELDDLADK